jgi:peptidoglycan/LPS O-acetylase OafA/YrhL
VIVGIVLTFFGDQPWAFWGAVGLTFATSIALLLLVDHPVDRWRQRRVGAKSEPSAAPGAATVAPL